MKLYGLAFDLGKLFFAPLFLILPFCGAAHGGCLRYSDGPIPKNCIDGVSRVSAGHQWLARIVIKASFITELPLGIEDGKMGSRGRAISPGDLLGLAVIEIRKIEMTISSSQLHLFEGVAHIGVSHLVQPDSVWIIRLDCDQRHPAFTIISGQLLDAALIELGSRAMITCKSYYENFAGPIVFEAVCLSVDTGQAEIRCGGSDWQRSWPTLACKR